MAIFHMTGDETIWKTQRMYKGIVLVMKASCLYTNFIVPSLFFCLAIAKFMNTITRI